MAEVEAFRESVSTERLFACWLMSIYGMRRSEVLGMRWSRFDDDELKVRRSRVPVGKESDEGGPKSKRSRRDLPLPPDLRNALRALKHQQKAEARALGESWSDDRLIAVDETGKPIKPDTYTAKFHSLRVRGGLRRIQLRGLRNTSVSLMLRSRIPVHIVAAWHGHDPAMSLGVYADAQPDDLRSAVAAVFERSDARVPSHWHTLGTPPPRPVDGNDV